jgi:hypothetical protein
MRTLSLLALCVLLSPLALLCQNIQLDVSFGTDGFIAQPISSGFNAMAMEVYDDGGILLAEQDYDFYLTVYRFLADGSPDLNFGTNGSSMIDIYDFDAMAQYEVDVEVLSNGHAIFLYDKVIFGYYLSNSDGQLYEVDLQGNLVSSPTLAYNFDNDTEDIFYKIEETPDTNYRVSGFTDDPFYFNYFLWVNTIGGSFFAGDTELFINGTERAHHTATIPGTDDYYIGGRFFGQAGIIKRSSFNSYDPAFGQDGFAYLPGSAVNEIYVMDNGNILATVGSTLYRLLPDGSLDTSFGGDGSITLDGTGSFLGDRFSYFADGRIMVAGSDGDITQYLPDGSLNTDFGTNGIFTVEYAGSPLPIWDFQLVDETYFVVYGNTGGNMVVGRFQLSSLADDLGVQAIVAPTNGDLSDSEIVSISLQNYGQDTQDQFEVAYQINGGAPVVEMIDQSVPPGETMTYDFVTTVDLSQEGIYEIMAYTSLVGDEAPYNDTTVVIIEHYPMLDVQISNLQPEAGCGSGFGCQFELKNVGTTIVEQVDLEIFLDGNAIDIYMWTGSLAPGESTTAHYSTPEPFLGEYELIVEVELVNFEEDGGPTDNEVIANNFNGELVEGNTLMIEFETDAFPSETTWAITDEDGFTVAQGGPYSSSNTIYTTTVCDPIPLNPNCYTLKLWDSYGDGLYGYVEIRNGQDEVLLYVDDFSDNYETYDFCANPCMSGSVETLIAGSSNPDEGSIIISVDSPDDEIQYSIDGGMTFQTEAVFSGLPAGTYEIVVVDASGCEWTTTVELEACALSGTVESSLESGVDNADASLFISPMGGFGSLSYSIDGGMTFQTDPLFEGLSGGIYNVLILDSEGCIWSETIEILTCMLTFEAQAQEESFPGAQDGFIEVIATGGFGSVAYSIDGGNTFQTDPVFPGLEAGTYSVVVEDEEGCQVVQEVTLPLTTGLDNLPFGVRFYCFPNPTSDVLQLSLEGLSDHPEMVQFQLIDMTGRVVEQFQLLGADNYQSILSVQHLPPGTYSWLLQFGSYLDRGMIIKQ